MKKKLLLLTLTLAVLLAPVTAFAEDSGVNPDGVKVSAQAEWTTGWNASRTQHKNDSGAIDKGLFKALQPDGVGALYYADDNGNVLKDEAVITVPGNKKRFLRGVDPNTGSEGFREVPSSDTNTYAYYITSASNGDYIVYEKTGLIDCKGVRYFVQNNRTVQITPGFVDAGNGVTYFVQAGGPIPTTEGMIDYNGKRYLLGSGGVLNKTVGLVNYAGGLYVLQDDHSVCTTIGFARAGHHLYYVVNSSGALARSQTIKLGKKKIHVLGDYTVAVGSHKWKGKWYFSEASGFLRTKKGIAKLNGKRYYVKKSGKLVTNKKIKYKKKYYIAGKDGAFKTGIFKWKKNLYYASKKGVLKTKAGKVTYMNNTYYVRSGGKIYRNTQFKAGGNTYMADEYGRLVSGVYKWKKKYYYANDSYELRKTKGIIQVGHNYYYNKKGGGLAKNKFIDYNGNHYYAGSDAVIKTTTFTYKGIVIRPSSKGVISDDDYYKVFPDKKEDNSSQSDSSSTNTNTNTSTN